MHLPPTCCGSITQADPGICSTCAATRWGASCEHHLHCFGAVVEGVCFGAVEGRGAACTTNLCLYLICAVFLQNDMEFLRVRSNKHEIMVAASE